MSINLSQELLDQVHALADATGVPLNQLVRRVLSWIVQHGHGGAELQWGKDQILRMTPQKGVFWLGWTGCTEAELRSQPDVRDEEIQDWFESDEEHRNGKLIEKFDFTERIIRRDL